MITAMIRSIRLLIRIKRQISRTVKSQFWVWELANRHLFMTKYHWIELTSTSFNTRNISTFNYNTLWSNLIREQCPHNLWLQSKAFRTDHVDSKYWAPSDSILHRFADSILPIPSYFKCWELLQDLPSSTRYMCSVWAFSRAFQVELRNCHGAGNLADRMSLNAKTKLTTQGWTLIHQIWSFMSRWARSKDTAN